MSGAAAERDGCNARGVNRFGPRRNLILNSTRPPFSRSSLRNGRATPAATVATMLRTGCFISRPSRRALPTGRKSNPGRISRMPRNWWCLECRNPAGFCFIHSLPKRAATRFIPAGDNLPRKKIPIGSLWRNGCDPPRSQVQQFLLQRRQLEFISPTAPGTPWT